jgi:cation diffusion facilitator CzcD-associated flavoprotein CzcO
MAIDLIKRNNCHNFVILEKGSSVGGTWNDNKYPGCCCDGVFFLLFIRHLSTNINIGDI